MLTPFRNFSFSCKSYLTTKNEARLHPWIYLAVIAMLLGLALSNDTAIACRTVNLTGAQTGTTLTDNNGDYQFAGLPPGFDYTVAPLTNPYFAYTPAQIFPDLHNNQVANFVGTQLYYSVSGWMQLGPYPAAFKQIPITGSISTSVTTDDLGRFSIDLPAGGNYTMTPSVTYYTFSPVRNDLVSPLIRRSSPRALISNLHRTAASSKLNPRLLLHSLSKSRTS